MPNEKDAIRDAIRDVIAEAPQRIMEALAGSPTLLSYPTEDGRGGVCVYFVPQGLEKVVTDAISSVADVAGEQWSKLQGQEDLN